MLVSSNRITLVHLEPRSLPAHRRYLHRFYSTVAVPSVAVVTTATDSRLIGDVEEQLQVGYDYGVHCVRYRDEIQVD